MSRQVKTGCSVCVAVALLRGDVDRAEALLEQPEVTFSDSFFCTIAELQDARGRKFTPDDEVSRSVLVDPEFDKFGFILCQHNMNKITPNPDTQLSSSRNDAIYVENFCQKQEEF